MVNYVMVASIHAWFELSFQKQFLFYFTEMNFILVCTYPLKFLKWTIPIFFIKPIELNDPLRVPLNEEWQPLNHKKFCFMDWNVHMVLLERKKKKKKKKKKKQMIFLFFFNLQ